MDGPVGPLSPRRVAIVGTPWDSAAALERLLSSRGDVVGIVAHAGRDGRAPGLAPLLARARAVGVPVLSPRGATTATALQWLTHLALDYVVSVGWSDLLTDDVIRVPRHGVVGLQRLPHRGTRSRVIPDWAVLRSGTMTDHVLLVLLPAATASASGEDGRQHVAHSAEDDTAPDVYDLLARTGVRLLETELADATIGRAPAEGSPGRLDGAGAFPPLGLTSFDRPAAAVHRWVQSMSRCGTGAFAVLRGEPLVIWDCEPAWGDDRRLPPGTVLGADSGVVVTATGGGMRLLWVQEPGRGVEPAAEWFARKAWPPGCAFEPVDWSALSWLRR